MFIMDTDVLSNLRKQQKHPTVQAWLLSVPRPDLHTTVISIAEIQCGIERQQQRQPDYAAGTQAWLNGFVSASKDQVFGLGLQAALVLARMHETPALRNFIITHPGQKRRKSSADLAISAIAIAEGATVATGNQAHFEEINALFPLHGLYNPFTGAWSVTPGQSRDHRP
jgi:predicted nucleic acid-binding protein